MSGEKRYLLDTNAIVSLLAGNNSLADTLENADWIGISVVSYLEFLAFDILTDSDREAFVGFCGQVDVVPLSFADESLVRNTLDLRSRYRLKLPDAIIGASAIARNAVLVTADTDFAKVSSLVILAC